MVKHLRDGEDFGKEHFSKDFGFSGSSDGVGRPHVKARGGHIAAPPYAADEPTRGPKHETEPMEMGGGDYAHGGHIEHHPHGHHVVHVEHRADGSSVHHHAHGGHTVHHAHGGVTHHHHDGSPVHAAHGGMHHMAHGSMVHAHPNGHHVTRVEPTHMGEIHHHAHGGYTMHHDSGQVTHHHADGMQAHHGMARGGDMAQDRAMISKAIGQHENHEHDGEHTDLHLARGGMSQRLPRGMKPEGMRRHSPIETPPRDPNLTTMPRNKMPAGQMAYGVEPSAEPDMAGSEQGIPQLRRGGRARGR